VGGGPPKGGFPQVKYHPTQHCLANLVKPRIPRQEGPLGGCSHAPQGAEDGRMAAGTTPHYVDILKTVGREPHGLGLVRSHVRGPGKEPPSHLCGEKRTSSHALRGARSVRTGIRPSLPFGALVGGLMGSCTSVVGQWGPPPLHLPQGKFFCGGQRQMGSLAGAAHLLKHNAGVLRRAQ
jgi:hypothetical protein